MYESPSSNFRFVLAIPIIVQCSITIVCQGGRLSQIKTFEFIHVDQINSDKFYNVLKFLL